MTDRFFLSLSLSLDDELAEDHTQCCMTGPRSAGNRLIEKHTGAKASSIIYQGAQENTNVVVRQWKGKGKGKFNEVVRKEKSATNMFEVTFDLDAVVKLSKLLMLLLHSYLLQCIICKYAN